MLTLALIVAAVNLAVVVSTYALYYVFVLRNRQTKEYVRLIEQTVASPVIYEDLPDVTVIIPMYNEEVVISKKLQNMAKLDYPIGKMQILLVDDSSTDRTCEVAEKAISELGLNGKIVKNPQRMGANASYNIGGPHANSSLILRTDADVILNADSLRKAVQIISKIENLGAVTGMMNPLFDDHTAATTMEKQYRNLYDRMSVAESALHSTYPGGGGFTLIKKSVFSPIPVNQGSTDGNISLSIIKKGFRHIYVSESFSFEIISRRLGDQMKQKVRRARRLIQSTILYRDFMFNKKYGDFGLVVFPFRFAMFVICPFTLYAGIFSAFCFLLLYSLTIGALFAVGAFLFFLLGTRTKIRALSSISSVLANHFYLLLGLFLVRKRSGTWKGIEGTKQWSPYAKVSEA